MQIDENPTRELKSLKGHGMVGVLIFSIRVGFTYGMMNGHR